MESYYILPDPSDPNIASNGWGTVYAIDTEDMTEVITPHARSPEIESQNSKIVHAREGSDAEDDDDSDSSDYLSFDESDAEDVYPETKAEREARAHERQLVLQAAGLIVTQDDNPPPRIIRARSMKRRPPPAAPQRSSTASLSSTKELPPVPQSELEPEPPHEPVDHAARLDDAFDRYESFKTTQGNRMSVASVDTFSSLPSISNSSTVPSPTKDSEATKSYSHFLHFLGRTKTPEGERRTTLNISAPIINGSEDSSRSPTPAFGTVCIPCNSIYN